MATYERRHALWALLAANPRAFTLRELAERFRVAKNTIQRDLDHLSRIDAALSEETSGQTTMYRVGKPPPHVALTEEERVALRVAGATFLSLAGTEVATALASALAKLGAAQAIAVEAKGPVAIARPSAPVLKSVLAGLDQRRRCLVLYQRRGATAARPHEVEPLRIVSAAGLLYLRAHERPRGIVTFALHLVKDAKLLEDRFTPIRDDDSAFGAMDEKPQKVVVRFHPDIAQFIEERTWHPSQRLFRERNGWLRFEATIGGMHEFVGWVMSWGGRAILREPPAWRSEISQRSIAIHGSHGAAK